MRPHFHKVPLNPENSFFSIRHDLKPNPMTIWHYHSELELHYVVKGNGVRFIGDNISEFAPGDMILLGENLPHVWRCKEEYFQPDAALEVELLVAHFLPHCLGKDFLQLPEAHLIPKLFEKAKKGILIQGKAKEKLARLMYSALKADNLNRLMILFTMLKTMAEIDRFIPVTTANTFYRSEEPDTIRFNDIYNYTMNNYKKDIKLKEIAAMHNMSISSFCRYFKLMTKKTYYNFVIEIRLSHACRMLTEDKLSPELICFDCGFNNLSNFYRHFKRVKGMTPAEYKRRHIVL